MSSGKELGFRGLTGLRSAEERDPVASEQRSEMGGHLRKKTGYTVSKKKTQPLGEIRNAH